MGADFRGRGLLLLDEEQGASDRVEMQLEGGCDEVELAALGWAELS